MKAYPFALGLIETWGVPALFAAADAAAKTADVRVTAYEQADAGLVTVYLWGDVASVRAAVDAGKEAASRVGKLISAHVIPRPDGSVPPMLRGSAGLAGSAGKAAENDKPPPLPRPPGRPRKPAAGKEEGADS